jgi:hypothetical protein
MRDIVVEISVVRGLCLYQLVQKFNAPVDREVNIKPPLKIYKKTCHAKDTNHP